MRTFGSQLCSRNTISLTKTFTAPTTISRFTSPQFSQRHQPQQIRMSSSVGELKIEAGPIKTAPGVDLSQEQQTIVGSVLDLFAGRPSLAKLQLWSDEGVFSDPITIAKGRKQYEAQWYGLQTAFSEIERQHYQVKSSGNPISMDLKTRYVVKGINKEQIISSEINIFTENGKITRVEDKWDGQLPDSSIKNAFRRLNAVTVPNVVGVPKNAEEDAKKGNQ